MVKTLPFHGKDRSSILRGGTSGIHALVLQYNPFQKKLKEGHFHEVQVDDLAATRRARMLPMAWDGKAIKWATGNASALPEVRGCVPTGVATKAGCRLRQVAISDAAAV